MEVEEPLLEETLGSSFLKEEEELEETLSLCDLPLYSDQSADWDQCSSLNSNSTSSSSQQDFFEFFNLPSAAAAAPENIIFCGKLIPYKKLPPCKTDETKQVEIKKSSRWRWKFTSTENSKVSTQSENGNKGTTAVMHQPRKRTYNTTKQLGKGKWHLFLFGVSRFSPVIELSDIRNRQSRRRHRSQSPPLSPLSPPPPPPLMFGLRHDKVSDRGGWGLWGLIRALSCGGNHYPAAVADGGAPPA